MRAIRPQRRSHAAPTAAGQPESTSKSSFEEPGTMPTTTMAEAHACTTRLDIHTIVRRLNAHLGATVVAALSGSRDSKLPYRWAKPDGPTPNPKAEERIRTAYRVWTLIADAETEHVARTWFVGSNPVLDETSPVIALREDRIREVTQAAQAFVDDVWSA